ncbi:tetratricopeptide repeat protein [Tardiphaga sp. 172_B4_N1_3]|uniref:tetratricopeptide repeat protein n=1 Tax=Tardiphaga sp. 172_B4_N1_3 TaxID=3240787 RepID=UPI003F899B00
MSDFTSTSIPIPKDWQAFERGIRVLFQAILSDPNTQNNGRIGQPQHGVDVYGNRGGGGGPAVGVQCKGKDSNFGGEVTKAELEEEVRKTQGFRPQLKEFILVTTAQTDAKIQEVARNLEQTVRSSGRDLSIAVWGWQQLENEIGRYPDALRTFHPDATPFTDELLRGQAEIIDGQKAILKELRRHVPEMIRSAEQGQSPLPATSNTKIAADTYVGGDALDKHLHEQINIYRDYLRNGRPNTALELLEKLKEAAFNGASQKIKFRILGNIGAALHRLEKYETAANYFIEAYSYAPEEPAAAANKIAALLIQGHAGEAHDLAVSALEAAPTNADLSLQRLQARASDETVEQVWPTLHASVRDDPNVLAFRIVAMRDAGNPEWRNMAAKASVEHPNDDRFGALVADSVLERALISDRSLLGAAHAEIPSQVELLGAANALSEIWEKSLKLESPPEVSIAHNGALLWKLLREGEKARAMLDSGFEAGLCAEEAVKLRLSLFARPKETTAALKFAERLSDSPQSRIIRAELYVEKEPARSRELLSDRESYAGRDAIPAAQVFAESLVRERKFDEALAEAERIQAVLPLDPYGPLIAYRIKRAAGEPNAERELDRALTKLGDDADFPTRFLICEALEDAGRFDDVVGVLAGKISTAYDSMSLRSFVAAAANSDRRSTLRDILANLPAELRVVPFYRSARIALAFQTGDIVAAEREIRGYLRDRPRNLKMQLQLMQTLFRQEKLEALRTEVAKPATEFDGSPSDFMKLAQFKEQFGDWREAYSLAYAILVKHPSDPHVSMGYVAVFLRPGHAAELDISPKVVADNLAVALEGEDRKLHVFVLETDPDLRPTNQYIPLSHKLVSAVIGKSVDDEVLLPDGASTKIKWIKPKELHSLHEVLESFQNTFPEAEGLERVSVDPSAESGMSEISARLQARHEAVQTVVDLYERDVLPLALAARSVGTDAVELMLGLSSTGNNIRVCQGLHSERGAAMAAININAAKGCVLDPVSFHIARRLGLLEAVRSVCGPIGLVDRTVRRYQRKIFELNDRIAESDLSLSWNDGKIYRTETSVEQKREALTALKADADWIRDNAVIVPADGTRDPSAEFRQLMQRFGSGFSDELRAAQGRGLLLVSEDLGLRALGQAEFAVPSTWLQPVLMKAKNNGALSESEYRKAIVAMIDARFTFVSVDAALLVGAVSGHIDISLPRDFLSLASRLGGASADLPSHVSVALGVIAAMWVDERLPYTARLAIVGQLLSEVIKNRSHEELVRTLIEFVSFGDRQLNNRHFREYIFDWVRGHFLSEVILKSSTRAPGARR